MRLYPTPGRVVIDPATGKALPEEGAKVEPGPFWTRRLNDGDVTTEKLKQKKPRTSAP